MRQAKGTKYMTLDEIQDLISHQLMFLTIAGAQREADGSQTYDPKMLAFAMAALNHLADEVGAKFKEKKN